MEPQPVLKISPLTPVNVGQDLLHAQRYLDLQVQRHRRRISTRMRVTAQAPSVRLPTPIAPALAAAAVCHLADGDDVAGEISLLAHVEGNALQLSITATRPDDAMPRDATASDAALLSHFRTHLANGPGALSIKREAGVLELKFAMDLAPVNSCR